MDDKIGRDDLEKYSREQLENIIINTCAVIDRFDIRAVYDNFSFRMEGKQYDAKTLVDMWNLSDRKCACDICDYRINNEKAEG